MMGIIGAVLRGVTAVLEVAIAGQGQGAKKKELAVPIAVEVIRQLAKAGVIPAALPAEEIGQKIDVVVEEQNRTGWVDLLSSSRFYVTVGEMISLIRAAKN